ncbi:MAG: hypothetical protein K2J10_10530 [Muribaculaceae bacterium]|nr:hypothetical protein [Muribaculaceae bacterium]
MVTAFMTWCGVVTLICAIVLTRVIVALAHHHHHHHHSKRLIHVVERSNEREMLFVPGDTLYSDGSGKDYNADDQ